MIFSWKHLIPILRRVEDSDRLDIDAAVMVGFWEKDGQSAILLTRRSATLSAHPSEICFPGGKRSLGESLCQTAIRETFEEVGLRTVHVLGALPLEEIIITGTRILPIVGCLESITPRINDREVRAIVSVSVDELLAQNPRWKMVQSHGRSFQTPLWDFQGKTVWGATGRILCSLKETIQLVV
jgi:8-oxo-dGTP pyrophosphatase MutT (NUDIX family)